VDPAIFMQDPYCWVESSLQAIHKAHWYRQVKLITSQSGPIIELEGRSVINFASNDYLGLAGDERLKPRSQPSKNMARAVRDLAY
jgi:8-amino-7-oxononanoate synthase